MHDLFNPEVLSYVAAACAALLGCTVLFAERRGVSQTHFAIGMVLLGGESALFSLQSTFNPYNGAWFDVHPPYFMIASIALPLWLGVSLIYGRGNALEIIARWRVPLLVWGILALAVATIFPTVWRVSEAPLERKLTLAGWALSCVSLIGSLLILMNLERTFRASVGVMRWRIKYMIFGLYVIWASQAWAITQHILDQRLGGMVPISGGLLLGTLLITRSLLRAGHFDVHLYPTRSVLQNSLTLILAGLYLFIIGVVFASVGSETLNRFAPIVLIALVGLGILLLSDRLRLLTRQFLSRHLKRPMYDYRAVWKTFTEGTTRRVEQTEFCGAVAKLMSSIFRALSVTIWLVEDRREGLVFAASTSLSEGRAAKINLQPAEAVEVIRELAVHPEPTDLDASSEAWASALRLCHPEEFLRGGNRVCVPMIAAGEVLGVIMLGDRVGGIPFSMQDFDLLKSVSDQAAAGLLNIQLSLKLAQSKQLEAFQAMSAFFVHDLKNTASTLTLMLQNLPVHYQDPQFREDALRGITKTVNHINDLIGKLNVLRHGLAIQPVDCDLNAVLKEALENYQRMPGIEIQREFHPLPQVRLDPSQIQKVVTNLVLNAKEALAQGGHITIETNRRDGWAVMSVADDGCGMSPDFMQTRLFRPFQTTKTKGIGIGMFHCKMIVEAHRGRIEVESEPGKGTRFNVLLPLT